jgi:ATP-dependent Lon protease
MLYYFYKVVFIQNKTKMNENEILDIIDGKSYFVSTNLENSENSDFEIFLKNSNKTIDIINSPNKVFFPKIISSLLIKDQKSISHIKEIYEEKKFFAFVLNKKEEKLKNLKDNFYEIGIIAKVIKIFNFNENSSNIIFHGFEKIKFTNVYEENSKKKAHFEILNDKKENFDDKKKKVVLETIKDFSKQLISITNEFPSEFKSIIDNIDSLNFLIYFLATNLSIDLSKKQKILESNSLKDRSKKLLKNIFELLNFAKIKKEIQNKVQSEFSQNQREQFLKYHIKAIQEELGEGDYSDIKEWEKKAEKKKWSKQAKEAFWDSINKIKRINTNSPDYSINVEYIETMLDLPWNSICEINIDLKNSKKILDKDHFGLEKLKERIIEYLAVSKLTKSNKSPILCLFGPPGVGKTSIVKSIAKSIGKEFEKISLGGLSDEAEIRGHRKTYIGAMPGKIISALKKKKYSNIVILLDEIDKLSNIKGDPSSALLEVLDQAQNENFLDHYLNIPYDLSKVIFVCTANKLNTISKPLLDRLEIIEVSGYSLEEKLEIAKKYLIVEQKKNNGLKSNDFTIEDDVLIKVIENYTSESGVRELNRKIGAICRKIAKYKALEEKYCKNIKLEDLYNFLGLQTNEKELYHKIENPGIAIGLAWTAVGGEILFIESVLTKGKGNLILSGQLGEVMKESANTAFSYLKSKSKDLDIDYEFFEKNDLHIHFPAGAIPKDGPSAGITIYSALASLYTKKKIKEKIAMTGEATLRGKVLPVGGIKEKILAAKRVGIEDIILSKFNEKDVLDIPKKYIENLNFHYVDTMDEVLKVCL